MAYVDIGVNYYGWDYEEIMNAIQKYAPLYIIAGGQLKSTVEASPTLYSSYAVGYIEMKDILDLLNQQSGEEKNNKDIMEQYLKMGPASFTILREHLGVKG